MTKTDSRIPPVLSIMGTKVCAFECFGDVVRCISERIASRQKTFCVAINPEKVYAAIHEPGIRSVLETAELPVCDGIGVAFAAWLLHGKVVRRCTDNLLDSVVNLAAVHGWRVFFLGATPDSNSKACIYFLNRYPNLQIAGCRDGYFQDSGEVVRQINEGRTDVLFVAMGTPRQEMWIAKHRDAITASFCMGVGGAFDVASGKVKRAPRFLRLIGLEFLYRLITQPTRFQRQLALPKYALMVLREKFVASTGKSYVR